MKCPHCLEEVRTGATRCPHCTGVIPTMNSVIEVAAGCFAVCFVGLLMVGGAIWFILKMASTPASEQPEKAPHVVQEGGEAKPL